MITTNTTTQIQIRKLEPSIGKHLKNIKTNDVFEGPIYLGAYDTEDNYIEVSEEEYEEFLAKQEKGE